MIRVIAALRQAQGGEQSRTTLDRVYWRLYAARRELQVRQRQYESFDGELRTVEPLAEALLEQARRFVGSGQRPPVEIIRAEAGAAQQLEAIIVAQNNLRDRERELKRVINRAELQWFDRLTTPFQDRPTTLSGVEGMQTPTVLVPLTEPDPVRYKLDPQQPFDLAQGYEGHPPISGEPVEPLVQKAVENRMEMLELELQIAQDTGTLDYMRSQALPLVTLDYRYNINGLGATEDDSYDLLFNKKFEDHRLGLQLVVPLGNSAAESGSTGSPLIPARPS